MCALSTYYLIHCQCAINITGLLSIFHRVITITSDIGGPPITTEVSKAGDFVALGSNPNSNHFFDCDDSGMDPQNLEWGKTGGDLIFFTTHETLRIDKVLYPFDETVFCRNKVTNETVYITITSSTFTIDAEK